MLQVSDYSVQSVCHIFDSLLNYGQSYRVENVLDMMNRFLEDFGRAYPISLASASTNSRKSGGPLICRYEGLIIDEMGYVRQSREEMEVLFTLLVERYERGSVRQGLPPRRGFPRKNDLRSYLAVISCRLAGNSQPPMWKKMRATAGIGAAKNLQPPTRNEIQKPLIYFLQEASEKCRRE
jgi:hypothetical protein